ncbi:MAG: hypothetical protein J6W96_01905 [Alphaproteobacteria bacterium]|nr:hypothetical protein [Alphaproteobacteria bacterium]
MSHQVHHVEQSEQLYIELAVLVDELLRFKSWTNDRTSTVQKDLFRIQNSYYLYTYENAHKARERRLCELSAQEFSREKQLLLRQKPLPSTRNWKKLGNVYELKHYYRYNWKKVLPAENCCFRTAGRKQQKHPPMLWVAYLEAIEKSKKEGPKTASVGPKNKQLINQAMDLSRKLGISFENVRSIGPDKEKLQVFQQTYTSAVRALDFLPPADIYELVSCLKNQNAKKGREKLLTILGVSYFEADVRQLNLCELETKLSEKLLSYQEQSIQQAIRKSIGLKFEEREALYHQFKNPFNKEEKKQLLARLGVDIKAIDIKHYPTMPLKVALAASIGVDI